jgi:hypothetical protein
VAFKAWRAVGGPPVNVRFLLEGEEEIGSPRLGDYMSAFPEDFAADVMVLTDCDNPSTDVPGLTVSLRGLLDVEVTLRALRGKVHSGLWGGAVPRPGPSACARSWPASSTSAAAWPASRRRTTRAGARAWPPSRPTTEALRRDAGLPPRRPRPPLRRAPGASSGCGVSRT